MRKTITLCSYFFLTLILFLPSSFSLKAEKADEHLDAPRISFLEPAPGLNKKRFWGVAATQVAGYGTTLYLLDQLWYQEYPRQGFNFHNDLEDWLQMDKLGHVTAAYHLSRLGAQSFEWAGLGPRSSTWLGTISAVGFMGVVEILDGFSTGWGFSLADFTANKIGAASFVSQQLIWQEQKILYKFSFSRTPLAELRPAILGHNLREQMLKDYNGQTYWVSLNLQSLSGYHIFPQWLNLAVGHGAYGMLSSRASHQVSPHYERYRQWYIAPDIDWQRIPTNSPLLSTLFSALNFIKAPAPALEYNRMEGLKVHLIFF